MVLPREGGQVCRARSTNEDQDQWILRVPGGSRERDTDLSLDPIDDPARPHEDRERGRLMLDDLFKLPLPAATSHEVALIDPDVQTGSLCSSCPLQALRPLVPACQNPEKPPPLG